MNFSNKLREVRIERNLSQKQMSELIEVQLKTYRNYEDGKTTPRISTFRKIAIALNVSSDELLGIDI